MSPAASSSSSLPEVEDPSSLCSSLASYLTGKTVKIDELLVELTVQVTLANKEIDVVIAELTEAMARELKENLEIRAGYRRHEMENAKKEILRIQQDFNKAGLISPVRIGSMCSETLTQKVKQLRESADQAFPSDQEDLKAFMVLKCKPGSDYGNIKELKANNFIRVESSVSSKELKLRLKTSFDDDDQSSGGNDSVWMQVQRHDLETRETTRFPKILLREINIYVNKNDEKECFTFVELAQQGRTRVTDHGFEFKLDLGQDSSAADPIVHVLLAGEEISASPQVLSIRMNQSFRMDKPSKAWRRFLNGGEFGNPDESGSEGTLTNEDNGRNTIEDLFRNLDSRNGNETRSGKDTKDLDASDRKAMGYDMTRMDLTRLSTVPEVSQETSGGSGSREEVQVEERDQPLKPQQHLIQGFLRGSPIVSRAAALNLEMQSPQTPIFGRQATNMDSPGNRAFTPGHASTETNLGERLTRVPLDLESEYQSANNNHLNGDEPSFLERGNTGEMMEQFQKNLSGDNQKADDTVRKNVSFAPSTTIYEAIKRSEEGSKNLTLRDLMRPQEQNDLTLGQILKENNGEVHPYRTEIGQTKTADGDQRMHKALLEKDTFIDPNAVTLDASSFKNASQSIISTHAKHSYNMSEDKTLAADFSTSVWEQFSDDEESTKKVPSYNLASQKFVRCSIKTFEVDGLLQSVARDPDSNRELTYVTDVENNKILLFKGWAKTGTWASGISFLAPRYIHCLPWRDVLVLDNKALYHLTPEGGLKQKLFEGEADRFRGLSFYKTMGRVVTTERKSDGVTHLVFIDLTHSKDIVESIPITATENEPDSKVRFVTVRGRKAYSTDLGLGRLYITNLKTRETVVVTAKINGANRIKNAMGVAVDPAGNILVASAYHSKIEVFSPSGSHSRTLNLPKLKSPTGICLQGKTLCAVDGRERLVHLFTVAEA